jgi:hypothetical protein
MRKRTWCYIMEPYLYDIECDLCHGTRITWSEFEHRVWCFDCEEDTKGTDGIFGGPIPIGAATMMGLSFDKIRIRDNTILKFNPKTGKWDSSPVAAKHLLEDQHYYDR